MSSACHHTGAQLDRSLRSAPAFKERGRG